MLVPVKDLLKIIADLPPRHHCSSDTYIVTVKEEVSLLKGMDPKATCLAKHLVFKWNVDRFRWELNL